MLWHTDTCCHQTNAICVYATALADKGICVRKKSLILNCHDILTHPVVDKSVRENKFRKAAGHHSSLQNKIWNLPEWSTILPKFIYTIKKESLPDQPKFCRRGSAVPHLFWRLSQVYIYGPFAIQGPVADWCMVFVNEKRRYRKISNMRRTKS